MKHCQYTKEENTLIVYEAKNIGIMLVNVGYGMNAV